MNLLRSLIAGIALALLTVGSASAQCGTTAPANKVCGNNTGSQGLATWVTVSAGGLTPIAGGTVLGNPTGLTAAPVATSSPVLGVPGTSTGQVGLAGATSGTAILRAQAAAGSAVVLLPTGAGTLASSASTPLVLDPVAGGLTCPTCVTSSGGGAITGTAPISVSAGGVVSINAPYTTLTASNGGIVYSGATNLAILGGTATARQMLQSGASGAPAWSTATWPATTTINQILFSSAANTVTGLATANSSVLVTNGSGVPSLSTTLPTVAIPAITGPVAITSTSASALAVGANGATNPVLQVDASTASVATGLSIKGAAAAGGVAVAAISSGTNESLSVNAKGSGGVFISGSSTGQTQIGNGGGGVLVGSALTYGGVTLANSVTGTGSMVLSTSPSLVTPALGVATATSLALGGATIGTNALAVNGTSVVQSTNASAFTVGANGATNPVFQVDASTASVATGWKVFGNAAGAAVGLSVISSGTNETGAINAKGSGQLVLANVSTGGVSINGPLAGTAFGTNVATALGTASGSVNGFPLIIANGTIALGTSLIASGACGTAATAAGTGIATTDVIDVGFNTDPTAVTGYTSSAMLTLVIYPTANTVNVKQCNLTASSITPSALTLNWRVRR
jgi:hypothetical protein